MTAQRVLEFISFRKLGIHRFALWCDNEVCVGVGAGAWSIKKLAFVARRVRLLQELCDPEWGICDILHVTGVANPSDALTKWLRDGKKKFIEYMARLYNCLPSNIR